MRWHKSKEDAATPYENKKSEGTLMRNIEEQVAEQLEEKH